MMQDHSWEENELFAERQLYVLKFMLHICVKAEITRFVAAPSCMNLDHLPFLNFLNRVWVKSFPWIQTDSAKFWNLTEQLLEEVQKLQTSAPSRSDSSLETIMQRFESLIVVIFKNILRPIFTEEQLTLSKQLSDRNQRIWKEAKVEAGFDSQFTVQVNSSRASEPKDFFSVNIVGTRTIHNPPEKPYEIYVIETVKGEHFSRVSHRYSDFVLIHEALSTNFRHIKLPSLPRKKRFHSHTEEFVQIRKRALNQYLQLVTLSPEIQNSGELAFFLMPGVATDLTDSEQSRMIESQAVDMQAESHFTQLVSTLRDIFHETGFQRLYHLYPTLKITSDLGDMPDDYLTIITHSKHIVAYFLYTVFHKDPKCEEHLETVKRLKTLTPFSAIRGIIKVSNPASVLQELMSLLLIKPLNSRNLLQVIISESVSQDMTISPQTVSVLREAIKDPVVCQKITNAIQQGFYDCSGSNLEVVIRLLSMNIQPVFSESDLDRVTSSSHDVMLIHKLIIAEIRRNDIQKVVDFCGDDKVIRLMKELIGIFMQSLFELYQTADLGELVRIAQDSLGTLIQIAENRSGSPAQVISAYLNLIESIQAPVFNFVHQITVNDNGAIQRSVQWFLSALEFTKKKQSNQYSINVPDLFQGYSEETREALTQEFQLLDEYYWEKRLRRVKTKYFLQKFAAENPTSGVSSFIHPSGSSDAELLKNFQLDGYISDDDLEDLSADSVVLPENYFPAINFPNLPILTNIIPEFIKLVDEKLFTQYMYG